MPETLPSNSQLLLSRKKSVDSKPPSCSERPLTLFHTAQPNEKRKCAEPGSPTWLSSCPNRDSLIVTPVPQNAVLLLSMEETIPVTEWDLAFLCHHIDAGVKIVWHPSP